MATEELQATAAEERQDHMPVHGIDHLEIFVGNAAQAAYWFVHAMGFREVAYRGLETGRRDRVSRVLEQGRVRLVLTGTLTGDDEIGDHHRRHGDSVVDIALSVPDAAKLPRDVAEALYLGLATDTGLTDPLAWAERHAAVVRRFGRFPHRNAILGRASTPEEEAFLKQPGSAF